MSKPQPKETYCEECGEKTKHRANVWNEEGKGNSYTWIIWGCEECGHEEKEARASNVKIKDDKIIIDLEGD